MNRTLLGCATLVLAVPTGLAAQNPHTCSEPGTGPTVFVHQEAPIEDLTVWRGTVSTDALPPAWRELRCVTEDVEANGPREEDLAPGEIPEDWGAPDLAVIQELLLGSRALQDLRETAANLPDDLPTTLHGVGPSDRDARPGGAARAVFIDPEDPARPVHVIVHRQTPALVELTVDSPIGSVDLSWSRSADNPEWRLVSNGSGS